ncbi:Rieske (2Fe-2S) protein [Nocardioides nanhaiensis]|uniref:Rieske domain-containing protein n=1 Tax=Nocardioides nanhaiensis TaxID=1476871 RepID=A0ABP8WJY6_9ACTN
MAQIQTSRRIVFQGMGALGVAAVLAACGGGGGEEETDGGAAPAAGAVLTPTADVPVGGGIVLGDQGVVVTQPTEGDFKAFTATCPHQGNTVTGVEGGTIECSFHGSSFSAETGEREGGPATTGLTEVEITVENGEVRTV